MGYSRLLSVPTAWQLASLEQENQEPKADAAVPVVNQSLEPHRQFHLILLVT